MKKKLYTYISNITLVIGGVLGGYVLIDFILKRRLLPDGACPLTNNRIVIFIAIVFLVISFISSIFEQKYKKSMLNDQNNENESGESEEEKEQSDKDNKSDHDKDSAE